MKKITPLLLSIVLVFSMASTAFADNISTSDVEYLSDGSYYVTTINGNNAGISLFSTTTTASKTTTYYNSNGDSLWYVKVTGTFTYTGSSSACTSSTVTAAAQSSYWKISSKSASRSGNTAMASATAKCYSGSIALQTITRTVNLTCSANGSLS